MTIISDNFPSGLPPLKQFKLGISTENVQCKQGLQLMIRNENNEPAYVKPESVSKLVDRGWGGLPLGGLPISLTHGNITNSTPSGNGTLPASFMPCDTPYPLNNEGFPTNEKGIPLLYMPKNSIGKICVNYYNILHSGEVQLRMYNMASLSSSLTGITISASQNTISNGTGNATVVYTIKTGNYSGLYGWNVFCVLLPFAVGYNNVSKITRADLTWNPEGTYYCPAGFYYFNIIGLSGIGFTMIP